MTYLEAPSGFEPLHKGFADLSLSHLGTAPLGCFRPASWSGTAQPRHFSRLTH